MKKLITILMFFCIAGISAAQNLQFMYGYGNQKPVNFVTFELFKPLEHGPVYFFTDFKIDNKGYFDSYTEVSKYWYINKAKNLSFTVQYNAGISSDGETLIRVVPAYLAGFQRAATINGWQLSLDVLYRYDEETKASGAQLTAQYSKTWGKFSLGGYCDLWNSGVYDPNKSATVIQFEPQISYLITKRISIVAEGRLSNYTLIAPYDNYIMGGLKWDLQ
jgi:hypothetical protein